MTIRPLGPEGVKERVREIENRIAEIFGEELQRAEESTSAGIRSRMTGAIGAGSRVAVPPMSALADAGALVSLADQVAGEFDIDPALFRGLISAESGWNPRAVSPKGATGLTQLMPETARGLGVGNPLDPVQNLRGGAKYLRQMLDTFGSTELALAAYNAGPGAVRRYGGVPPFAETQNYVKKIIGGLDR